MSRRTPVTLAAGGKSERQVPAGEIVVPDLWHLASAVKAGKVLRSREEMAAQIKEVWHLAHDLHNHILHSVDLGPMELLATTHEEDE